jgi:hypothetical protein
MKLKFTLSCRSLSRSRNGFSAQGRVLHAARTTAASLMVLLAASEFARAPRDGIIFWRKSLSAPLAQYHAQDKSSSAPHLAGRFNFCSPLLLNK